MDRGEPALNVPVYNGGLFITLPSPVLGRGAGGEGGNDIVTADQPSP